MARANLFLEPLNVIRDHPVSFMAWLMVILFIGLAGFWIQLAISIGTWSISGAEIARIINSSHFTSYSIVILAEGIASGFLAVGASSNDVSAGMRTIIVVLAIVLVSISVGFMTAEDVTFGSARILPVTKVLLAIFAISVASYLYCFRFPEWEKQVGEVKEKEDKEVGELGKRAQSISSDDEGVRL